MHYYSQFFLQYYQCFILYQFFHLIYNFSLFQIFQLLFLVSNQQLNSQCDYQVDLGSTRKICTHQTVFNNIFVDINIQDVDQQYDYSLSLNIKRIINSNISVTSQQIPKVFSLSQSIIAKEIVGLSYNVQFSGGSNQTVHLLCNTLRNDLQISDSLIQIQIDQTQQIDLVKQMKYNLTLVTSIFVTKQQTTVNKFFLVEEINSLCCNASQFNFDLKYNTIQESYYSLTYNANYITFIDNLYYGTMQFQNCFLIAYKTNGAQIENIKYNITVIDSEHAQKPAFVGETGNQTVELKEGSGNIYMSFNSWTDQSSQYQDLDNFNEFSNVDIFSSQVLQQARFNNSIINLVSQSTPQQDQEYSLTNDKTLIYNVTFQGQIQDQESNNYYISLISKQMQNTNMLLQYLNFTSTINIANANSQIALISKSIQLEQSDQFLFENIQINSIIQTKGSYYGFFQQLTSNIASTVPVKFYNIEIEHQLVEFGNDSSLFIQQVTAERRSGSIQFDQIKMNVQNVTFSNQGSFSLFILTSSISTAVGFQNCEININVITTTYVNNSGFINNASFQIQNFSNNIINISATLNQLVKSFQIFGDQVSIISPQNNSCNITLFFTPYQTGILRHEFQYNQGAKCGTIDTAALRYILYAYLGSITQHTETFYIDSIPYQFTIDGPYMKELLEKDSNLLCTTQGSNTVDYQQYAIITQVVHMRQTQYTTSSKIQFVGNQLISNQPQEGFNLTTHCNTPYSNSSQYVSCYDLVQNDQDGIIDEAFA